MIKSTLAPLLLILLFFSAFSQKNTDNLVAALDTAKNERKVKVLNELFRATIQSDPVKALGYTREALSLATEINDKKGQAASYNNLGVAYKNQGVLDKSLEYYLRSLNIYEGLDNVEGIATTKNNIATIYSMKGDYEEARKYLEESFTQFTQLGDQRKLVGSLNNLGTLFSDLQQFDEAEEYFKQAYQLSVELNEPFSDPMNNMGNVYFRQGDYAGAIDHYQKALEMERAENDKLGILNSVANIGIAYTHARQPIPAQKYLEEAERMAKELEAFSLMPAILKAIAENQFRLGDKNKAYLTLLRYDSARESVYGQESSRNIAKMETALSLQEKEKEFEILKKDNEIKTLELHNSRLFISLLILSILIIVASVNFYYMGRRKKFISKA
jgi:tetratricopeptide (TPR) repeat protein